jgi:hypothetical protein
MCLCLSTGITRQGLALSQCSEDSLLDLLRLVIQAHMSQHHDTGQQKSSWVCESLARDIRSGTVHSLEDRALVADVAGGSGTKTTDQASAHVGENVSVQIGDHKDLVRVRCRVGGDLHACVVEQLGIELNIREVPCHLASCCKEETVRHFHDRGLVDNADLAPVDILCILERIAKHTLGGLTCDKLDGLDHTVKDHVLDTGVFALSVFSDEDGVDIIVGRFIALDGFAWTNVGEEVERSSKCEIEGDVALADGCS